MRSDVRGRAAAFRHVKFLLCDDGRVTVLDDEVVLEEYSSLARALMAFGLRRGDLEVVDDADEWSGLPLRGP